MLGICVHFCGQRFLETGDVSGPGTNSIEQRGPVRVANHEGFFSIVNFHVGYLAQLCGQRFLETARFQDLGLIASNAGDL